MAGISKDPAMKNAIRVLLINPSSGSLSAWVVQATYLENLDDFTDCWVE